jgi:hypothetical protein
MDSEPPIGRVVVCYEQGSASDLRRAENAGIPAPFEHPCQAALPFGKRSYTCTALGEACAVGILPDLQQN